jgi:hypothetical protein
LKNSILNIFNHSFAKNNFPKMGYSGSYSFKTTGSDVSFGTVLSIPSMAFTGQKPLPPRQISNPPARIFIRDLLGFEKTFTIPLAITADPAATEPNLSSLVIFGLHIVKKLVLRV